jgi:hypothetical protein
MSDVRLPGNDACSIGCMANRSQTKRGAAGPGVRPRDSNANLGGDSPAGTEGTLETDAGVEGSAAEHGEGMGETEQGYAPVDPHPDNDDDFDDDGSGRESIEAVLEDHDEGAGDGDDGGAAGE